MVVEQHKLDNCRVKNDIPVVGDKHVLSPVLKIFKPLHGKSGGGLVYDSLYDSRHY